MARNPAVLRAALMRLQAERTRRKLAHQDLLSELYARCPRLAVVDRLQQAALLDGLTGASTGHPEAMQEAQARQTALSEERLRLLGAMHLPPDCLEDRPMCELCGDTGYQGQALCACLKKCCAEEQTKALSARIDLERQSFDAFDLGLFSSALDQEYGISPRENVEVLYDLCADYAQSFGKQTENLFFNGGVGTGKTFLTACIAGAVSKRGFWVVYDTAIHLLSVLEAEKFDRDDASPEDARSYIDCDLLIVDDLGTEFLSPFVQSALYNLVNRRLTGPGRTIISSNLTMTELRKRYTPQIVSRLEGEYRLLFFFGEDLRMKKGSAQTQ